MKVIKIEIKEEYFPAASDDMHTIIFAIFENQEAKYVAIKQPFTKKDLAVALITFGQSLDK